MITMTIDGSAVAAERNDTILEAAKRAEIYIPTLCHHPDLRAGKGLKPLDAVFRGGARLENDPARTPKEGIENGCGLCAVEDGHTGELVPACTTLVREGMRVITDSDKVKQRRQEKPARILADHPHACLTCAQKEGCPRSQCSLNVPENERCCPQLGVCELEKVADYVGIAHSTGKWIPTTQPVMEDEPLFLRDYNLCIGCTRCVRACRDLRGVEAIGFVFDREGSVRVGSVAPTLKESGCKFCTACVEVCPTGAIRDLGMKNKPEDLLPCVDACPAGIDIPRYLRLLAEGKVSEALCVIREKVPLPGILGRVCVRPCEAVCRRGTVNEPVSICALKRFAADFGGDGWKASGSTAPDTGKKIAVVGAGPAGLTAAFHLRKRGHEVTLYDANDKPGGMMRYGIPSFRLPESVLDREISDVLALGIDYRPNCRIGEDLTLAGLKRDFDAVFIAVGARLSRRIPMEGSGLPEVIWGTDFLREVNLGGDFSLSGKVVVIGGGAVAIDVSMTARRLGADEVHIVCLEDRDEMPANSREIEEAEEEGVLITNCWGPLEVVERDRGVHGVHFKRCVCVFDGEGEFNPTFDDECAMGIEADTIIPAVGQQTDLGFARDAGIELKQGLVKVDEKTLQTSVEGIFAGGDAVLFPGAIIHAIAAGRKAASQIDKYLGGSGDIDETLTRISRPDHKLGREEGFAYKPRFSTLKRDLSERTGFEEVDLGFGDREAVLEAARCLQCDLRLAMSKVVMPPERILAFTVEDVERVPAAEGAVRLMDGEKKPIVIKGTEDMRAFLLDRLDSNEDAKYFDFEEDPMFSKRESELVQQHLRKYGEMPGAGGDDDDLFGDDDLFRRHTVSQSEKKHR
jgi:NADPH-dependent glutamate synthase beta subunit-like oxidoreductase